MNSTPDEIAIRPLLPDEWEGYKCLRLEALQREPQAFGASYANAALNPESYWRNRLESAGARMLFAVKGSIPVGMVAAYARPDDQAHIADIVSVYVTSSERGKGIARRLMERIIARLSEDASLRMIALEVNQEQSVAVKLYESLGFQIVGEEYGVMGDGNAHNQYAMEKVLRK